MNSFCFFVEVAGLEWAQKKAPPDHEGQAVLVIR
jgi:hypothetical protein